MANKSRSAQRKKLRQVYRNKRRALSPLAQRRASISLARMLIANPQYRRSKNIAAYLASDGEIDLSILFAHACRARKIIFVPMLDALGRMRFVRYKPGDALGTVHKGFAAPARGKPGSRHLRFDLVLMPLVAFDNKGNRLGRGGGHYDRYFSSMAVPGKAAPLLFGVAHALQQAPGLEAAPWDVGLDAVATDRGIQYFRGVQSRTPCTVEN
ncbi:MAG: 5-formyltetrahydrofolate cyclo-ligase [Pseudomonadales bacterium]|nr:5-formyltetrahydrofolate cyclo-ligase [Pseudomonadales bacterium]